MDLEDLDEWWLSSETDSEKSVWTLSDEQDVSTVSDRSVSDIFADSDSDKSQTLQKESSPKKPFDLKTIRVPVSSNSWRTKTVRMLDLPCATVQPERNLRRGTKAVREIRRLQKTGEFLIPQKSFARVVKDICRKRGATERFESAALDALQEASEQFLVKIFQVANDIAANSARVTILERDFALAAKTLML